MTDSELLKDYISKRDEDAFAEIVLRYERLVWSVCHRLLINHGDREDAFQETFLVLARSAHRIRKPGSMSNWLYGVTWKTASRIRKRRALLSLDDYIEGGNEIPDPAESQLDRITRLNEFELVNRHLQSMPEMHRTPLILFYFSGFTAKQIAGQLNLSVAATEGRLRRAREKLRRLSRGSQFEDQSSSNGSPALQGSMLLLLSEAIHFKPCAALTMSTVKNSLTATAGVSSGVTSGVLSSGAKLMICKYACAVGISALLALGGLAHTGVFQEYDGPKAQVVLQQSGTENELNAEFVVVSNASDDTCCDLCDCCNGESCDLSNAVNSHFDALHYYVRLHAQQVCELIGCCGPESVDEE